ncbi:skin secretory protein xP2-like [Budorcas taxicolor]|uniref:skin secretory protein xP2-like n=1 Tax=Budorcas taxicolor TaxID=37181 RepID=UPI00228503E5|nr:skin secretory protein xP2-like [Budorcas taxicolor]
MVTGRGPALSGPERGARAALGRRPRNRRRGCSGPRPQRSGRPGLDQLARRSSASCGGPGCCQITPELPGSSSARPLRPPVPSPCPTSGAAAAPRSLGSDARSTERPPWGPEGDREQKGSSGGGPTSPAGGLAKKAVTDDNEHSPLERSKRLWEPAGPLSVRPASSSIRPFAQAAGRRPGPREPRAELAPIQRVGGCGGARPLRRLTHPQGPRQQTVDARAAGSRRAQGSCCEPSGQESARAPRTGSAAALVNVDAGPAGPDVNGLCVPPGTANVPSSGQQHSAPLACGPAVPGLSLGMEPRALAFCPPGLPSTLQCPTRRVRQGSGTL